ncbi:MAG: type I DNA topoisomerase [Hydrotalea sp.]|nr:type I DNA topoisomerase [Hydrotalea sp.]MDI9314477.1 type I DNA topoisomerase [Hydrotalea sp.]
MPSNNLVIVESPSKAKTINKYLGSNFRVIASMGHVRDLSAKSGSVNPDNNFSMTWLVNPRGEKQLAAIADAITPDTQVYLATDPDREGEAISWHLAEELTRRKKMPRAAPQRIVFHEITEGAIKEAMQHPRGLDHDLIAAYLARRALDYLVGYSLSPILWRKLPGSRSAGRVQSTALRLIVEREMEIRNFQAVEYWSLTAALLATGKNATAPNIPLTAALTHEGGKRLDRLAITSKTMADDYKKRIQQGNIILRSLESREVRRHPAAPFTTSTLQQEASRKLGFTSSRTMQIAQQLYEGGGLGGGVGGLISYMRTDSTLLSGEAIAAARRYIAKHYSPSHLPASPRQYKTKSKNAQEAHEAIRPTNVARTPDSVAGYLRSDQLALYKLIWQRTVASQMESAVFIQTTASFDVNGKELTLTATGQTILFDGFLKLYQEGKDDEAAEENRTIPPLASNSAAIAKDVSAEKHFTDPPPRYSEASLIKKMEEIGIGRPSTYANIINILQTREYVRLEKKRFFCENRGIVLSAFLTRYYNDYFNYNFTAQMEDDLDEVANGKYDWHELLRKFWEAFAQRLKDSENLLHENIQAEMQSVLTDYIFGMGEERANKQKCQKCSDGKLTLQIGRYGPYLSCSNYPNCDYRANFEKLALEEQSDELIDGVPLPKFLGKDDSGRDINVKKGPYGFYVEQALAHKPDAAAMDDATEEDAQPASDDDASGKKKPKKKKAKKPKKEKPKRASIPKTYKPADITLPIAIKLLSLPRTIGRDPNSGEDIIGAIGPFGPYLKMGLNYYSLKGDDNVLDIGINRAIDIIATAPKKKNEARVVGTHPDGGDVVIKRSRWGYYLEWLKPVKGGKKQKKFAKLAPGTDAKNFTLDLALVLFPPSAPKAAPKEKKKPKSKKTKNDARDTAVMP